MPTAQRIAAEVLARLNANRFRPWPSDAGKSEMVFVMGSGRSGTHLLGYILDSHPDIRATIEKPEIFNLVTRMAIDATTRWHRMPRLVEMYRRERAQTTERYYGDKSHPSIWIAEYLADAIPTARFVGISRDPYQTVASMIRHEGVSGWPARWREFPVPNRFLGIDAESAKTYDSLSQVEQHTLRWISHKQRLAEVALLDCVHVLHYDDLQDRTEQALADLQGFLGLTRPFPAPAIERESVDKWRSLLTDLDMKRIEAMTGVAPPA